MLFIDWEAQFSCTIQHCENIRTEYRDVIEKFYWVALPLTTQNSLTQFSPEWQCWEPGVNWVRQPPADAITDPGYFPFYSSGMSFEEFVRDFADWFSQNRPAAMMVGIRADESLNRFMTISSQRKLRFADDKPWTTSAPGGHTGTSTRFMTGKPPISGRGLAKAVIPITPLRSDVSGRVPLRYMRICEPFGPEQRQGLWLYHVLEPERWAAICQRVNGVHSGGIYAGYDNKFYGHRKLDKPGHHSWKSYALFLLDSMPRPTAEHYRNKIAVYLHWYQNREWRISPIAESDIGTRDIPSWRRVCKVLLNNDYWCRQLSFSPTKATRYKSYCKRISKNANNGDCYATTTNYPNRRVSGSAAGRGKIDALNHFRRSAPP